MFLARSPLAHLLSDNQLLCGTPFSNKFYEHWHLVAPLTRAKGSPAVRGLFWKFWAILAQGHCTFLPSSPPPLRLPVASAPDEIVLFFKSSCVLQEFHQEGPEIQAHLAIAGVLRNH